MRQRANCFCGGEARSACGSAGTDLAADNSTDQRRDDPLRCTVINRLGIRTHRSGSPVRLFHDVPMVYLHREPVDFRKAINGLALIVEHEMTLSPYADALFLFCNKQRDKLKILWWDQTGFCLWYKRLEKAKFKWPRKLDDAVVELTEEQLHWLLRGLDITKLETHPQVNFVAV